VCPPGEHILARLLPPPTLTPGAQPLPILGLLRGQKKNEIETNDCPQLLGRLEGKVLASGGGGGEQVGRQDCSRPVRQSVYFPSHLLQCCNNTVPSCSLPTLPQPLFLQTGVPILLIST
jgi:hypothetical protein